ncbi:MAG: pilus assembly protein [Planctomycetota bacterium]|nr:pilus assembly protein [Planctomycetota bacterium]
MEQKLTWIYLLGLTVIAVLLLLLRLIVAVSGGQWRPGRLVRLHHDQQGSVQSLSFVLTLPFFIMIMMGIVQATQMMVAQVVLEYAAIATARSAAVWIPAHIDGEGRNHIDGLEFYGEESGGTTYHVGGVAGIGFSSPKRERISLAAAQACMSIAPSRETENSVLGPAADSLNGLQTAFSALATDEANVASIPRRVRNKLAYSVANTRVQLSIFHPGSDPDLQFYSNIIAHADFLYVDEVIHNVQGEIVDVVPVPGYEEEVFGYQPNEIGWQDEITVVVRHDLALLPGPGRLLSRWVSGSDGTGDTISETIQQQGGVYTWPLVATATISNEGQQSVLRYEYDETGFPY